MATIFTYLDNCLIGSKIEFNEITESTNSLAAKALQEKEREGAVFIADYQKKGRGQRGNFWESEAGKNLTFSVLTYPTDVQIMDHFYLSMVVSNGVVEAVAKFGVDAKVKWPNDIYYKDLKIAGILIENGLMGTSISHSIWGIGLNVNQKIFTSDAPNPSSLKNITGNDIDRNELLHEILRCINGWYAKLKGGQQSSVDEFYFASLYRKDGYHPYSADGEVFMARIHSIEHTGELVLETDKGELRSFAFKEVTFVL